MLIFTTKVLVHLGANCAGSFEPLACFCFDAVTDKKPFSIQRKGGEWLRNYFMIDLHECMGPGAKVMKLFSYSTQLSTKFILLINVKMPTIVGILTFISMINTTSERLKARHFIIWRYFSFYEQLKFYA